MRRTPKVYNNHTCTRYPNTTFRIRGQNMILVLALYEYNIGAKEVYALTSGKRLAIREKGANSSKLTHKKTL